MAHSITRVRFDTSDQRLQQDLKATVDDYFLRTGLPRTASAGMWWKAAFWIGGLAALLALGMSGVLPPLGALVVAAVAGVFMAAMGFNVGHDAIHGAFSSKPWVNNLLSRTFDVSGASSYTWAMAHNFVHHTYTNVPGVDHDLDPGPFMVFSAKKDPHWIYRFQHIYAFALYFFTYIVWVFKKDFVQILGVDLRTGKRQKAGRVAEVMVGKVLHLALFVGLPMLVSGYSPLQVVLGYLTAISFAGLTLAVVFQLAHVVEGTAFPTVSDDFRIDDSWAAHQLRTTANFAITSPFWNFFTGGLNHQVEHHLLYKIAHCHYPALSPLVREVAARHNVPYNVYPTFSAALFAHVRTLKRFGRGVDVADLVDGVGHSTDPLPAE
jgi:linoleoyl-CoA desaturase